MRLIRPVTMVRLSALLLGMSVCLAPAADAATKTTRKKTTTRTTSAQSTAAPRVAEGRCQDETE